MVGGGGFCKSVIDVAEDAGYEILGILDLPSEVGKECLGYQVIGTDEDIPKFKDQAEFVVTVGHIKNSDLRRKIYEKIKTTGGKVATIIAKDAYVSRHASVGEGSLIMHKVMLSAEVKIGKCTIINTLANISHETHIGDFCHISTCASINGACIVDDDTFIGSQSVLNQGVSVCKSIVGSYSLVNKNIFESGVYVGIPAKFIKPL
jgi:sugar O-acyltransferase (sialic acid O-acetyltransferase NeuD family)